MEEGSPRKTKRTAEHQISKDDDSEGDGAAGGEVAGTFQRAPAEVLRSRRSAIDSGDLARVILQCVLVALCLVCYGCGQREATTRPLFLLCWACVFSVARKVGESHWGVGWMMFPSFVPVMHVCCMYHAIDIVLLILS